MESRRFKLLLGVGALAVLLLLLLKAATALVLPAYVESRLIPKLTRQFGLDSSEFHVRRIGWWGADLGPIQFAAADASVVSIAAVQIDYSPLSLAQGQVNGIILGGLRLNVAVSDNGVTIPGLAIPEKSDSAEKPGQPPDLRTVLPFHLKRFAIRQSEVVVDWNRRRFSVPFAMTLDGRNLQNGVLGADIQISILGNPPLAASAQWNQATGSLQLALTGRQIQLDSLAQTGRLPDGVSLAGQVELTAEATVQLAPFEWTLSANARIGGARMVGPQVRIGAEATAHPAVSPIAIDIAADSRTGVRWACAPVDIQHPFLIQIEKLEGQWKPDDGGWTLKADMISRIAPQTLAPGVTLPEAMDIQWTAGASQRKDQPMVFKVGARVDQPTEIKNEWVRIDCQNANLDIQGDYLTGTLKADINAGLQKLAMKLADGKVEIPNPSISSRLTWRSPDTEAASEFEGAIDLANVSSTVGTTLIRLPRCGIKTTGRRVDGRPWDVKANIHAAGGQAFINTNALALNGIEVRLPVHWPPGTHTDTGRIHVGRIQWQKRQLGDLKGTLKQQSNGLNIALRHRSKLFPGLIVLINGGIKDAGIIVDAELPPYKLPDDTDLGQFMPPASGLILSGRVAGSSRLKIQFGSVQSTASIELDQGRVFDESREIDLDGIRANIAMEDVFNLRSGPQQRLEVDRLRFGNLSAQALAVAFQLEPNRTLFIEKAGIDWCRGRINTAAIRIVPGKDDYDVTLFCDRLNLAMLLEQLGAAKASGDGSVNGRIPLRWTDGKLSFDNGFLYSTPGQSGAIQLSGTEVLLSGLPPGTPQHTQLDIATEALKDYTYNWAKLSLTSEKDDLLLKLKFDGKPNRLLPFAYDKSLGQFKRVAGQGQADFKGISIDLNFKSPLNDIIHYKEFLKQD